MITDYNLLNNQILYYLKGAWCMVHTSEGTHGTWFVMKMFSRVKNWAYLLI